VISFFDKKVNYTYSIVMVSRSIFMVVLLHGNRENDGFITKYCQESAEKIRGINLFTQIYCCP
jgi:hypothetical protein